MFCLSCVFLRTDPSRLARFWSCSSCSLLSKTSYFLFPQLLTHIRSRQIYLTFYENFINLTHLLASSRPPRSLSALLTGQLWNRLIIISIGPGRWWNGPGVVGVGVRLPVHAAFLPPLAPVEHPEVARRTQRRVRVVLALQTLVTRLMGKIFLYYIKIFWKNSIRTIPAWCPREPRRLPAPPRLRPHRRSVRAPRRPSPCHQSNFTISHPYLPTLILNTPSPG